VDGLDLRHPWERVSGRLRAQEREVSGVARVDHRPFLFDARAAIHELATTRNVNAGGIATAQQGVPFVKCAAASESMSVRSVRVRRVRAGRARAGHEPAGRAR
jgi:hypothetical protein